MSGDRSDGDILDEARHEQIIEQEEKIHREYPVLVRRNEELVARVKSLEADLTAERALLKLRMDLHQVEVGRTKTLREQSDQYRSRIFELEATLKSLLAPTVPVVQEKPRKRVHNFTSGICRECHQRILWGVTKNGKNIPLNTKPVVGEMVDWNRDLEAELKDRGIEMRRGYDELGDQITVAVVENPDPLLARVVYPVHFQSCSARNLSSNGGSTPT